MTRGQIAIITKEGIMTSTEFNGDMYMSVRRNGRLIGNGQKVINALQRTNDIADYQYEVAKFNKENHHYNDTMLVHKYNGYEMLDFTKDYFANWFSDYVYLKNLTKETAKLETTKKEIQLEPNQIAVLNFGELVKVVG